MWTGEERLAGQESGEGMERGGSRVMKGGGRGGGRGEARCRRARQLENGRDSAA